MIGLYGDPDTSWGIAIDLGLPSLVPVSNPGRSRKGWPHSVPPTPTSVPHPRWSWWTKEPGPSSRAALAAADYGSAALLRVAVCDDGRRLAVGAHHGAVDGLGLVAVAAAALGQPLLTRARGIGDRPARSGFLRSSLGRLGEALVDPPPRFAGQGEVSPVEDLSELTRPLLDRGTAHLAAAAARVFGDRGHDGRPLLVIGASRRIGLAARGRPSDGIPEAARACRHRRRPRTPSPGRRGPRTRLPRDVGARGRPAGRPSPAPTARRHRPAEQPGTDRRSARLDRDVPRVQRPARGRGRPGLHEEHDHLEPADPPYGLHGRRARAACSPTWRPRSSLLRRRVSRGRRASRVRAAGQPDAAGAAAGPSGRRCAATRAAHRRSGAGRRGSACAAGTAPSSRRGARRRRSLAGSTRSRMPSVTPIEEKASWTRTEAPGGQERPPAQVVGEGPARRACRRCRRGRHRRSSRGRACVEYSSTWRTTVATPARSRLARNFSRVGNPPNSRPSTNGSIAITSPPAARATWPSRTVERPWWLPISSRRAPGPAAAASSNSSRPWSLVSQPGTGSARAQATSKSGLWRRGLRAKVRRRHRRPAGRRRAQAPRLHSRAAQYRVEGVSHRHQRGDRDPPSAGPSRRRGAGETMAAVVVGTFGRRWAVLATLRVAGGHGVPAAPRRDDVRHEVRPDLRRRAFPGAEPVAVEAGLQLRRAAEPGLRLPLPPGGVLPAGRQSRGARLGRPARLDGTPPGRRLRGGAAPVAGPATGGLAVVGVAGRHRVRHRTRVSWAWSVCSAPRSSRPRCCPGSCCRSCSRQQGRVGLRAGALWSGVAVLFIGGVNAVENLAALPLPLFVVLVDPRPPGWRAAGALVAGRRRPGERLVDAAPAGAGSLQPAVPRLHRDVRGRGAPAGLDQRRSRRRPLGLLRVRRAATRGGPAPTTCPPIRCSSRRPGSSPRPACGG